ncbi:hypothetical protein TWF506_001546 [Arthrobotrys conoides]|uniref:F-box domain-containing protein n=1 Tax=Arthrobotrys conoides TaxID=74498 RepID=A0AAN8PS12_9PEZI
MASPNPPPATIPTSSTSTTPLLNLPKDVFLLFLNHLTYTDILSVSLTTKGLYYLNPPESTPGYPGKDCARTIRQIFLTKPLQSVEAGNNNDNKNGYCSYCPQKLCPPTCPSAIILDSKTGIFYPTALYPYQTAVPASTSNFPDSIDHCSTHFTPKESSSITPKQWDNTDIHLPLKTQTFNKGIYKTIWCNHHRCPPSLLDTNFHKQNPSVGAYRLYRDYNSKLWTSIRYNLRSPHLPIHIELPRGLKEIPFKDLDDDTDASHPPQQLFLNELCYHCRLPINTRPWYDRICECPTRHSQRWVNGEYHRVRFLKMGKKWAECNCEPIIVRIMLTKGFEIGFKDERGRMFYFGLAVEVGQGEVEGEGGVRTKVLKVAKPLEVEKMVGMMAATTGGGGSIDDVGFEGLEGYKGCEECKTTRVRNWDVDLGC